MQRDSELIRTKIQKQHFMKRVNLCQRASLSSGSMPWSGVIVAVATPFMSLETGG